MKIITYKKFDIVLDMPVLKIYLGSEVIFKSSFYFYRQDDILKHAKTIINIRIKSGKTVNLYA